MFWSKGRPVAIQPPISIMPRLGRDDTGRLMVALQRLCALDPPLAANLNIERLLGRLRQRAHQAGMPQPSCARTFTPPTHELKRNPMSFKPRVSIEQVEEDLDLAPKFDARGLITCVTSDVDSGDVLMVGYMNPEALERTIQTGEAHYFSRSRQVLWHKGATSGLVQRVVEMRIDDDQDAVWLRVQLQAGPNSPPASCHVGYRSCFYRAIDPATGTLQFVEDGKTFDPLQVYGDEPNPTQL